MPDISKLTKAQLINIIQQQEENKYDALKEALGLPHQTDDEWIKFIKDLIDRNNKFLERRWY
jgi:Glu-tRNA(Gln) amidotransferase subunit E-like FAD-binding protein|tara:strand:+ start:77 stop:262 length:186 start_codon:yes stop_codon:yes gene_type:complete